MVFGVVLYWNTIMGNVGMCFCGGPAVVLECEWSGGWSWSAAGVALERSSSRTSSWAGLGVALGCSLFGYSPEIFVCRAWATALYGLLPSGVGVSGLGGWSRTAPNAVLEWPSSGASLWAGLGCGPRVVSLRSSRGAIREALSCRAWTKY